MQSYYNFDVEGMQQRSSQVLFPPSSFTYAPVNAGICEPFIPCIEPGRYRLIAHLPSQIPNRKAEPKECESVTFPRLANNSGEV
jgi:hypothetical protein